MEAQQKEQICELILKEKARLGSFAKVGRKCGVSEATISLMRNKKWNDITESKWLVVGHALGYRPDNWVICKETRDYQYISTICNNAKDRSMFMIISNEAGSGKTTGLENYCKDNSENSAFYLQAREWSAKVFLVKILNTLGVSEPRGYHTADDLLEIVVSAFTTIKTRKPILCVDEFDKLKPAAKRMCIYLFNELEDQIAFLIAGTENLHKEITAGVRYAKKGYDEIESRFGRTYLPMIGANKSDVTKIIQSNGITENYIIEELWKEVGTKRKPTASGRNELICDDLRRLKRIVQREQLKMNQQNVA